MTWKTLGVGVVATLIMDILTGISIKLRLSAPLAPGLVGRWFASVARGQPLHANIATASPVNHEMVIALLGHYTIGVTLASVYLWGMSVLERPANNGGAAIAFGLCTNVLPWLLMFPAMGYGLLGRHGPQGTRLFVTSVISHLCFGVGLWIAAATFVRG